MSMGDKKGNKISGGNLLAESNYKPLRVNHKAFIGNGIKGKK